MASRTILGIDPGYGRMGFGMIKTDGRSQEAIDFGVITTETVEFGQRLLTVAKDLETLLNTHKPDVIALEELFLTKNTKTAIKVAEARGIVLLKAAERGIPVIELTPSQAKAALTGDGKAPKSAMQQMTRRLLNLPRSVKSDDAADALAFAIAASTMKTF